MAPRSLRVWLVDIRDEIAGIHSLQPVDRPILEPARTDPI
jgi:hypothetical protein